MRIDSPTLARSPPASRAASSLWRVHVCDKNVKANATSNQDLQIPSQQILTRNPELRLNQEVLVNAIPD